MEAPAASESAITVGQASEYLRDKHSIEYSEEYLMQKAQRGEVPSHKVGRNRMFRRSLLDSWALGEWTDGAA